MRRAVTWHSVVGNPVRTNIRSSSPDESALADGAGWACSSEACGIAREVPPADGWAHHGPASIRLRRHRPAPAVGQTVSVVSFSVELSIGMQGVPRCLATGSAGWMSSFAAVGFQMAGIGQGFGPPPGSIVRGAAGRFRSGPEFGDATMMDCGAGAASS